jgi:hypothetical protein
VGQAPITLISVANSFECRIGKRVTKLERPEQRWKGAPASPRRQIGAVVMASRRSKHDQDARTISTPAKKRSRKLAMPSIIELPDNVDVVVVKKRGVFHLKCSAAGKAILTLILDEDGLASLTRMLWLAAKEANDNQPVKSPAAAAELLELIKSCEETILELIKSKGYSNRYSAQRRVADEFAYSVMKRIRAMNFKRGARAKAIKEVAEIEDINRPAEQASGP